MAPTEWDECLAMRDPCRGQSQEVVDGMRMPPTQGASRALAIETSTCVDRSLTGSVQ